MTTQALAKSSFFFLRDRIEQEIARSILGFGPKTKLRDACEYALLNEGKRLRPIIVMLVADALGCELNVVPAAMAIEFFHTASLIADDLPCMDNDDERRQKPALHKIYGESIALLSSYALISAAFGKIRENAEEMKKASSPYKESSDLTCSLALEAAARCSGILGATGGQFLDLFPPKLTPETLREIIYKKTVTLFEGSFLFGWLFGGGDTSNLEEVKQVAYHLGIAFQIADDMGDIAQDQRSQRSINSVTVLGKDRAVALFDCEMEQFKEKLISLHLYTPSFEKMRELLIKQVASYTLSASSK